MNRAMRDLFLPLSEACVLVLLATGDVLAASTDTHQQPTTGASLFIAFAIAYVSRRRAIGGWLLYFYIQLYLSLLISLIFVPQVVSNLSPRGWDNAWLYVMFFLSVVPVIATQCIEVFAATRLLFRRSEHNVKVLRGTLVALLIASISAVAIDLSYFRDDPGFVFDVITCVFAIIWALYSGSPSGSRRSSSRETGLIRQNRREGCSRRMIKGDFASEPS